MQIKRKRYIQQLEDNLNYGAELGFSIAEGAVFSTLIEQREVYGNVAGIDDMITLISKALYEQKKVWDSL